VSVIESDLLFDYIADQSDRHARTTSWWQFNDKVVAQGIVELRPRFDALSSFEVGPLKNFKFSHHQMGSIDSLDLFGLDELILFSFYWRNRYRYRNVVDLGANIGLHSTLLGMMGYSVTAFEPDPLHCEMIEKHLVMNSVQDKVVVYGEAVTASGGPVDFIRVLGNTTGSHVSGAKGKPYGETQSFTVQSRSVVESVTCADLVKMDVEGLEAELLGSLSATGIGDIDFICEVGSEPNANFIWQTFSNTGINIFSQKCNWQVARRVVDLPISYREGSVFISRRSEMPW